MTERRYRQLVVVALAALGSGCVASPPPEIEALERYLETEFRDAAPGGAVLVARGDTVLYRGAFGLGDLERSTPVTPDSAFPIASVTKSFTAGAVLGLVADGAFALSDDVAALYPDYPLDGRSITVEQLLTNTSGLPNLVDNDGFEEWAAHERTVDELLAQTHGVPFRFEPGEGFFYSDTGYILLGAIVERHSGLSFADFIEERLAVRAGLSKTFSAASARGALERPVGYTKEGEQWVQPQPIHPSVPHGAGVVVSTVDDLFAWVRSWTSGAIATPELVERAWSARTLPDGTHSGHGFGWKVCTLAGETAIGHGGWIPGFTAGVVYLPGPDLTAIALVNNDMGEPEASYVARRALRVLLRGAPLVETVDLTGPQRERLIGHYRMRSGTDLRIEGRSDGIVARWGTGGQEELVALAPDTLAFADSDGTYLLRFELPHAGPAPAVTVSLSCEPRGVATRVYR